MTIAISIESLVNSFKVLNQMLKIYREAEASDYLNTASCLKTVALLTSNHYLEQRKCFVLFFPPA